MEQLNMELTPAMLALAAVVGAVIQILKNVEPVKKYSQWLPVMSMALGVGAAHLQKIENPIMAGVLIGLVACGAYDVLKNKSKEGAKPPK